jgi:hemerythrin
MSGYSDRQGTQEDGTVVLAKPFTDEALLGKVAEALGPRAPHHPTETISQGGHMSRSVQFLETSFATIDDEHAEIARSVGQLVDAVNSGRLAPVRDAVRDVVEQVAAHFAHEERLMREHGYSQLARHKEAHDLFLADVSRFQQELTGKGLTPNFRRWAIGRLFEWFRFHIAANDVGLGLFLLSRHPGQAKAAASRKDTHKPT